MAIGKTFKKVLTNDWIRPNFKSYKGDIKSVTILFSSPILIRGRKGDDEIELKEGPIELNLSYNFTVFPFEFKSEHGTELNFIGIRH